MMSVSVSAKFEGNSYALKTHSRTHSHSISIEHVQTFYVLHHNIRQRRKVDLNDYPTSQAKEKKSHEDSQCLSVLRHRFAIVQEKFHGWYKD